MLVDPLPLVRAGLALLVERHPEMEVLAETGTADEALDAIRRTRRARTVVVVGLSPYEGMDAFSFIRAIRERFPSHAVLAMGSKASPAMVSRALFTGADGYVDKSVDPDTFTGAIGDASKGEMVLVGPASSAVGEIAATIERRRELDALLTAREREVLTVAAEGLTARQIAVRLGVAERTVTTHLARIYAKLGVGSRLGAVRAAARSGLVAAVTE